MPCPTSPLSSCVPLCLLGVASPDAARAAATLAGHQGPAEPQAEQNAALLSVSQGAPNITDISPKRLATQVTRCSALSLSQQSDVRKPCMLVLFVEMQDLDNAHMPWLSTVQGSCGPRQGREAVCGGVGKFDICGAARLRA
jgi:hypothetical protein